MGELRKYMEGAVVEVLPSVEIQKSADISIRNNHTPLSEALFPRKHKVEFNVSNIDDEYTNDKKIIKLKSLKKIVVKRQFGEDQDITNHIDDNLSYLSRTRKLECNTIRTKTLQDIADRMTEGTNIKTRVVVMNKGANIEAFVFPDGTICISQSLINKTDNLDEIGAIIAHEIGHLKNDTFGKVAKKSGNLNLEEMWAIGRVHEMASDTDTLQLLEKAGLNSMAFASIIEKTSGAHGGKVHQGGYVRSSQSIGLHWGIDFDTSGKRLTVKPPDLDRKIQKTNIEFAADCIRLKDPEKIKILFERCHPRDMRELYVKIYISIDEPWEKETLQKCNEVLLSRMKEAGYSQNESLLFLLSMAESEGNRYFLFDYHTLLDLSKYFLQTVREGTYESQMKSIEETIFQKHKTVQTDFGLQLFNLLNTYMFDIGFEQVPNGIPVTKDLIFEVLETMNEVRKIDKEQSESHNKKRLHDYLYKIYTLKMQETLMKYHSIAYLSDNIDEFDDEVLKEQTLSFYKEAEDLELGLEEEKIKEYMLKVLSDKYQEADTKYHGYDELDQDMKRIDRLTDITNKIFGGEKQEKVVMTTKDIDDVFSQFEHEILHGEKTMKEFQILLERLNKYFSEHKLYKAEERLPLIQYLLKKINTLNFTCEISLLDLLNGETQLSQTKITSRSANSYSTLFTKKPYTYAAGSFEELWYGDARTKNKKDAVITPQEQELNQKLFRFNMQTAAALFLFQVDGEDFYKHIQNITENSGIDFRSLNKTQLINLTKNFFSSAFSRKRIFGSDGIYELNIEKHWEDFFREGVSISKYDKFLEIPLIKEIVERCKNEPEKPETIQDLLAIMKKRMETWIHFGSDSDLLTNQRSQEFNIYDDNIQSILLFEDLRKAFEQIIQRKEVNESDYPFYYEFILHYYPKGEQRDKILREINKTFLRSKNISIEEKTKYLVQFFDQVGPEGAMIVAEDIEDIETYRRFRDPLKDKIYSYLAGSDTTIKVARGDYKAEKESNKFDLIFETCKNDPATKERASTEAMNKWMEEYGTYYDKKLRKFAIRAEKRDVFQSPADFAAYLQNLSATQRFILAQRSLVGEKGAFSTPENRKKLGDIITNSLSLEKKGFIDTVLWLTCKDAEPKLVTFPFSKMLGKLLFRALHIDAIKNSDLKTYFLKKNFEEKISNEEIDFILHAETRELTVFGGNYSGESSQFIFQKAQESDVDYQEITDRLNQIFGQEEKDVKKEEEKNTTLDSNIEAVIKGVEGMGAMGVRSLQLATQLQKFAPEVERRMSEAFDANPGLNKLLFWENLLKLSESNGLQTRAFIERIRLKGYLGGGSLYTTYLAELPEESGVSRQIVIKMLNPNSAAFVGEINKLAQDILEKTSKTGGDNKKYAQTALLLANLSHQWCLRDITDGSFEVEDALFRQTIDGFNRQSEDDVFYAPNLVYNSVKLKSEELASGKTLNKFLNDDTVPFEKKQEIVAYMAKFFMYQLRGQVFTDENGKSFYLVHSDPHVGNYMVDIGENSEAKLGVIDRNMYLRLAQKDVEALEYLISGKDNSKFLTAFVERMLEINNVQNVVKRTVVMGDVLSSVVKEKLQQRSKDESDDFSLLRIVLERLAAQEIDVPLEMRLMIRNIGAIKELASKYKVEISS